LKKLIVLFVLFFLSIMAYSKPLELKETINTSIAGADSIAVDSAIPDSLIVFGVEGGVNYKEVPMRTNYFPLVAERSDSLQYIKTNATNNKDDPFRYLERGNHNLSYNKSETNLKESKILRWWQDSSSFKTDDIAT